jgi:hypothetical protein
MRYTKKDAEGRYYIEGANGALENNTRGYTYGEAINRLAELEDALEKASALSADEKMSGYIRKADLKAELLRRDFYPAIVKNALETIPPVDVVPKAEVENLQEAYNNRLVKDIQTNAEFVKYAKADVAREIIAEILTTNTPDIDGFFTMHITDLDELKKKYTGEQK